VTTGDSAQVEFRVIYNGYVVDKNLNITSRQDGNQVEFSARVRNNMNWAGAASTRHCALKSTAA